MKNKDLIKILKKQDENAEIKVWKPIEIEKNWWYHYWEIPIEENNIMISHYDNKETIIFI
jgi:hypothetical protein